VRSLRGEGMTAEDTRLARQLLDRINADAAALRLVLDRLDARPVADVPDADRLRARCSEMGIRVGADGCIGLPEAARLVDRTERTLRRWRESGDLEARPSRGRPRFSVEALARAIMSENVRK
jgi:hypothetical protein